MYKSKRVKELENRVSNLESRITQLESRVMIEGKKVAATVASVTAESDAGITIGRLSDLPNDVRQRLTF